MSLLKNNTILVTNCCSALGETLSEFLGKGGAKLVVSDSKDSKLSSQVEKLRAAGVTVEAIPYVSNSKVQDRKAFVYEAAKKFGGINSLVALSKPNKVTGDIIKAAEEQFDTVMKEQLTSRFRLCQEIMPVLEESGHGSIVMTTSIAGFTPFVDIGLYSIAQHGLLGMCKALAISAAKRQVRINTVCTGMIVGDGSGAFWDSKDKFAKAGMEEVKGMIPVGRFGQVADVCSVVEFLLSDRATYVTGENIVVSGGVNVRF